jgi:medium-chain acyl-[acyl-carrier-protein] hydrolase
MTLESLVASIVEAIRPLTSRAFSLFGHSMGGLVAYETARLLRQKYSATPIHLFVSAIRAAHLPDPNPKIFDLPDKIFIEQLQWFGSNPLNIEEESEILKLMLPTLRADFRIVQTYQLRSEPALTCPITAFGGLRDNTTGESELKEWRHHTSSAFELVVLPGGHHYLDSASQVVTGHIRFRLTSA